MADKCCARSRTRASSVAFVDAAGDYERRSKQVGQTLTMPFAAIAAQFLCRLDHNDVNLPVSCLLAVTQKHCPFLLVAFLCAFSSHMMRVLSHTLCPDAAAGGLYHSLVIAHTLSQRDVQEMLALHNISAAARSQRVRNAGMSIAYNVGALQTKLGRWAEAVSCFQLALRMQDGSQQQEGSNRADVLHGLALVSSHSGA